jgi:hypothetical protein
MILPATANLTWAITKGCATVRPILVAVDAEAHNMANKIPAPIHLYSLLMVTVFVSKCKIKP